MNTHTHVAAVRSACQANAAVARSPQAARVAPAAAADAGRSAFTCLMCSSAMFGVHCKLICRNCGYREDCSDLFRISEPRAPQPT